MQVVTEGEQASKDSGQTLESVGRSVGRHWETLAGRKMLETTGSLESRIKW